MEICGKPANTGQLDRVCRMQKGHLSTHRYTYDTPDGMQTVTTPEAVDHPQHYGGVDNLYEAIKVIEAWELGFCLGNTVKYISRAGIKVPTKQVEDLKKARWYLDREIANLENTPTT